MTDDQTEGAAHVVLIAAFLLLAIVASASIVRTLAPVHRVDDVVEKTNGRSAP